jgi:ABC-type polysaccharide/polyol phosphate export permease
VTTALFFLPVAFLLTGILGISLALIFSIVCVYLRDTSHIITIVMQAVYYMTPIIYPISLVPKQYHIYFQVNPLVYFIGLFRAPIYEGRLPDLHTIGICVVTLCVTSLIGLALFQRFAKTLIFRL